MSKELSTDVKGETLYTTDAAGLIAQAIDKNVPVETMEKLLAMRRELKEEQAKESFFRALAEFQAECPVIEKRKQVHDKNGKHRYSYAPLEDIVCQVGSYLQKHGFSYTIDTVFEKDPPAQLSTTTVHHIDGHSRTSTFRVPIDPDAYMNEPQKHASAVTFGKRHSFINALGILTGDEDNDTNSIPQQKEPPVSQEYEELKQQILTNINNKHFTGNIMWKNQPLSLDEMVIDIQTAIADGVPLKNLRLARDNTDRMLLIAEERDAEVQENEDSKGKLDDEIQDVFQGKLVDIPEETVREGNLNE